MIENRLVVMLASALWLGGFAVPSSAGVILAPVGATTNMTGVFFPLVSAINQSGLSVGYTGGTTDFDAYLAANPRHTSDIGNDFISFSPSGRIDFDLGTVLTVGRAAIWNFGCSTICNNSHSIREIQLLASLDAAFTSPVVLGSFTLPQVTISGVLPAVLAFTPTSAEFVRMEILSNYGGSGVGLGEIAFVSEAVVPEPASAALIALGVAGLGWCRRKKK